MRFIHAGGLFVVASVLAHCGGHSPVGDASDASGDLVTDARVDTTDVAPDIAADVVADDGPVQPSGIGNACTGSGGFVPSQGDCADGQLCLDDQEGFPGGYCVQQCDTGTCPGDSVCITLAGRYHTCLLACTTNADCRTQDGYACHYSSSTMRNVCVPVDGPVGTRDGGACYTTTPGPNQLPALQRTTFSLPNVPASQRSDVDSAAEGNVTVSPENGNVTLSYIAEQGFGAFMGSSTTHDGLTISASGRVTDPTNPQTSDPVLAYTLDGQLWMTFIGYQLNADGSMSGTRIRVANSMNDGNAWGTAVGVDLPTTCAGGCDKPWITTGPAPGDAGTENIYVGFLVDNSMQADLTIVRSEDHGATWSTPHTYAGVETLASSTIVPNLQSLVVTPDGTLHAVYAGLNALGGMASNWGDPSNRIAYRRSLDGGRTWTGPVLVSRTTDSPVYNQPFVGVDGTTIYVVYTTGDISGAWDVILATSSDYGMTWHHRKVNDEPDSCATHAFPVVVADTTRHVAHVTWMENRFGDGAVGYAHCPQDYTMPCSTNEAVTDATFMFTTARDPSRWHGDYMGLTLSPVGDLWAIWSDTRTGTPQMYLSHGVPH